MSDLLSTIIAVVPHTATVVTIYKAARPALSAVLKPALEEVGELGRDYVKSFRAATGAKVLSDADTMLAAAEIAPRPVALKILVPLLESASLEEEEFLRTTWAALLANAANPRVVFDSGFVEIMKQLSPLHVVILSSVLALAKEQGQELTAGDNGIVATSVVRKAVGKAATPKEFDVAVDNLLRLRLCASMGLTGIDDLETILNSQDKNKRGDSIAEAMLFSAPGKKNLEVTDLGMAFITACKPPMAHL